MLHQTLPLCDEDPCWSVQVAYWATTLEGAPQMLQLPGAMSRPEVSCGTGYTLPFELTRAEYTALQELGRKHSASVLMLITAVFKVRHGNLCTGDLQQLSSLLQRNVFDILRS